MKSMKIKTRLIMAFSVTIVLALLTIGLAELGTWCTGIKFSEVLEHNISSDESLMLARIKINTAARHLRDMGLNGYSTKEEKIVNENLEALKLSLEQFNASYPLSDGKSVEYTKKVESWMAVVPQIVDLFRKGENQRGVDMIKNHCTPALDAQAEAAVALSVALTTATNKGVAAANMIFLVSMCIVLGISVIALVFVVSIARTLIRDITIPMQQAERAIEAMSRGDFAHKMEYTSQNEIGMMMEALRTSRQVLEGVVSDVDRVTEEMAEGNFNVTLTAAFPGSLRSIETSIMHMVERMSDTLNRIAMAADQVASGADQVSSTAQALAQGAAEQASSVEELSSTIDGIAKSARTNSEKAKQSKDSSLMAGNQIDVCSGSMLEMVESMSRISGSSQEIGKIIATIENIAFQTNILALNAAVEAARAGEAGKGFAVVADEVRNLASKSDQAAKATKELIENSIHAVEGGSKIVRDVNAALQKTVGLSGKAVLGMGEIAVAVNEETDAITQVTEGIQQISAVIQTNSNTSQESAAASEELSSQAEIMHQLLARFRLRGQMAYKAAPARTQDDQSPM